MMKFEMKKLIMSLNCFIIVQSCCALEKSFRKFKLIQNSSEFVLKLS